MLMWIHPLDSIEAIQPLPLESQEFSPSQEARVMGEIGSSCDKITVGNDTRLAEIREDFPEMTRPDGCLANCEWCAHWETAE